MAFDLRAILRLEDRGFSSTLRRIQRETERANRATQTWVDSSGRLRNSLGQFARSSDSARSSASRFRSEMSRGFGGAVDSVGGLTTAFVGLAGAIGGAVAAKSIFDKTVGEAMKYEMSSVTIDAMFNDKALGKQYRDMVEKIAIESPILESQEALSSSRGFITKSKDFKDLEKMMKLTEKLAAYDPIQGTKGAAFSLNEFMSGDTVSLVERFELSRTDLKPIKDLFVGGELSKGLDEFDKYLEKIGISKKLINDMGNTTMGKLAQVKEQLARVLREMGEPSLTVLSNFFTSLTTKLESGELDKFANIGANMIKSILNGLTTGVTELYNWFQSIANNPEFQAQTTLAGKVEWIIDDVYAKFLEWLDGGGQDKIQTVASDLIQILAGSIEASMEAITPIAVKVGQAIGNGVINGAKAAIESSWLAKLISDPVGYSMKWISGGLIDLPGRDAKAKEKGRSSSAGLDRVPYNGFKIHAHKGEMLLTKNEADSYRKNRGGSGGGVTITGNTFNVRQESDIQAIAYELAKLIEREGVQMG
jgi:hypothetical protein